MLIRLNGTIQTSEEAHDKPWTTESDGKHVAPVQFDDRKNCLKWHVGN